MKIKALSGETILIDKKDYKRASQYEWKVSKTNLIYCKPDPGGSTQFSLHYLLLDFPSDPNASSGKAQVRHKNGNKFDNRRSNLKIIRNKSPVELRCKNCENSYMACGDIANRKFCSADCSKKYTKKEREQRKKIKEELNVTGLKSSFRPATKPKGGLLILDRDGFQCALCGASSYKDLVRLHVDHIIPWSRGGRDYAYNLITMCERCNLEKSDFLLEEKNIENLQTEARRRNLKYGISDNLRVPNNRNYKKW